jgi:hypothetical protein
MRRAAEAMEQDIDNTSNFSARCLIENQQIKLADAYAELANVDIDLRSLNLSAVIQKIQECYSCIAEDFAELLPGNLTQPQETVNYCKGDAIVPLEHIKQFVIYEATDKNSSIPNWIEAYNVTSNALPYTFTPSTDIGEESGERYWIWWDTNALALAVKVDAAINPEINSPPLLSFNVAAVIAQLKDEYVDVYGSASLRACTAMLMSNDITWEPGHDLGATVDNSNTTFSQISNNPPEAVVYFQFKV